jgi:hypothetical protein
MSFAYYNGDRSASSVPRQHQPKQYRHRAPAWERVRREIEIERRMLTFADPYSPRIRPSLAPVGRGLR